MMTQITLDYPNYAISPLLIQTLLPLPPFSNYPMDARGSGRIALSPYKRWSKHLLHTPTPTPTNTFRQFGAFKPQAWTFIPFFNNGLNIVFFQILRLIVGDIYFFLERCWLDHAKKRLPPRMNPLSNKILPPILNSI